MTVNEKVESHELSVVLDSGTQNQGFLFFFCNYRLLVKVAAPKIENIKNKRCNLQLL